MGTSGGDARTSSPAAPSLLANSTPTCSYNAPNLQDRPDGVKHTKFTDLATLTDRSEYATGQSMIKDSGWRRCLAHKPGLLNLIESSGIHALHSPNSRCLCRSQQHSAHFPFFDRTKKRLVTSLHDARRGEMHEVRRLLQLDTTIDEMDVSCWTPLLNGVYHGHRDIAELLLTHRASVDAFKDPAVRCGTVRSHRHRQAAVQCRANIDTGLADGTTPLAEWSFGCRDTADEVASVSEHDGEAGWSHSTLRCRAERSQDMKRADEYVDDLEILHVDPSRYDIAWRLGIDTDVMDETIKNCGTRNFIKHLALPFKALFTNEFSHKPSSRLESAGGVEARDAGPTPPLPSARTTQSMSSKWRIDRRLHKACREGQEGDVQRLLEQGAEVDARGEDNRTPLMIAVRFSQHKEIVDLLVANGANINARDTCGWTPLYFAACWSTQAIVELLLARGASIDMRTSAGSTPLIGAASNGRLDAVRVLLEHGARIDVKTSSGKTALLVARSKRHTDIAELLESYQVSASKPETSETPATKRGSAELAVDEHDSQEHDSQDHDLQEGDSHEHDSHERNSFDRTPLHLAAQEGQLETIQRLVFRGANVNDRDASGRTALHFASGAGSVAIARTILHLAASVGGVGGASVLEYLLLQQHLNVNAADGDGCTPLHRAVHANSLASIALLLAADGVQVDARDHSGATPLTIAVECGHADIAVQLIDAGADVNAQDTVGESPLFKASALENAEL
ncbi:hypothetical protein PybrP1_000580, partial [[Pythium] brassicae (nom. inval.)]